MSASMHQSRRCALEAGTFVELGPAHLAQVATIERRSFANPWSKAELGWVVQEDSAVCLGLEVGGGLVGYSIGQVEGAQFHLASLAIAPPWRRQGWGGQLLIEMLNRARQRGCRECRLEVRASNQGAARLYGRHGFRQVGVWPRYYTRPVEDALVMSTDLQFTENRG